MRQNKILDDNKRQGIEASLSDLIQMRPAKGLIDLHSSTRVTTQQWGAFHSSFLGRGMEFAESRMYQSGDDVRNIDWQITARTGQTHTKLFHEERERPIYLLVDMRSMMQFGTRKRFKSNMVAHVAAMLAWVGFDGGDRVGGHVLLREQAHSGMVNFRGARTRRSLLQFLQCLSQQTRFIPPSGLQDNGSETSLAQGVYRLRKTAQTGSLVFVLSDFYDFDNQAQQELIRLSKNSQVCLIQVIDALDKSLPRAGQVSDGVTSIALQGLTEDKLSVYSTAFAQRQQHIQTMCAKHGMVQHHLSTSDDMESVKQSLMMANLTTTAVNKMNKRASVGV